MKKISVLLLMSLLLFGFCKKSDDSTSSISSASDDADKYTSIMCGKMSECMKEQMKAIPENLRAMAEAKLPTKESCIEMARKHRETNKQNDYSSFTDEQKAAVRKCADATASASCDQIMKRAVAGCEDAYKLFGNMGPGMHQGMR